MNLKNKNFKMINEIVNYQINDPVTSKVCNFYETDPFPNYTQNDNINKILQIGDHNFFYKSLKDFIGFNKNIVEIGSGTCQLSNYLAIGTNNNVCSFDSSFNSLEIGKQFAKKNNIKNISFVRGDIFDQIFQDDIFDFLICSGVLHHTRDPYSGFLNIIKSVKKNGYIIIGLYNKIGRIRTNIRKYTYKILGKKVIKFMDPVLRKTDKDSLDKINAWIKDQYLHPVESTHTFDEILNWFDKNNIEFINSMPELSIFEDKMTSFFNKKNRASLFERILSQILMIFDTPGSEGAIFIFIGKKK